MEPRLPVWRARFVDDFQRDGWTLHLWRPGGPGRIQVAHGELLITDQDEAATPEQSGVYLPSDAYEAIRLAIDPAPHGAEVRRLEEALAVERQRVDRVLAQMTASSPPSPAIPR